jgi:Fe-S-cluster formation regulator IscX/YfhJ
MKFKNVDFEYLSHKSHLRFHTWFCGFVSKDAYVVGQLGQYFDKYMKCYNIEKESFNKNLTELETSLRKLNEKRNMVFKGMKSLLIAHCEDYKEDRRDAAQKICEALKTSWMGRKAPNAKNSLYDVIAEKMKDENIAEAMSILGMSDWVTEMEKENKKFQRLLCEGNLDETVRFDEYLWIARFDLDVEYERVLEIISTYIEVDGEEKYKNFVEKLTTRLDKFGYE